MSFTTSLVNAAATIAQTIKGTKAVIVKLGKNREEIPVQFNPSEYRVTDKSSYSQRSRRKNDEPDVTYNGGVFSTLEVTLIFNRDEFTSPKSVIDSAMTMVTGEIKNDITAAIGKISALTKIDGNEHMPPKCMFAWGTMFFVGYVENVGVNYTMFDKSGIPLRAMVNLTMQGTATLVPARRNPLLSPDRTKARTMTEDSSIWCLAEKEYGDAREWRRIADANDIMNPLDIPVGRVLKVPSIND